MGPDPTSVKMSEEKLPIRTYMDEYVRIWVYFCRAIFTDEEEEEPSMATGCQCPLLYWEDEDHAQPLINDDRETPGVIISCSAGARHPAVNQKTRMAC